MITVMITKGVLIELRGGTTVQLREVQGKTLSEATPPGQCLPSFIKCVLEQQPLNAPPTLLLSGAPAP